MITIGLLGGVASGKSRVAAMLAGHGAGVLNADQIGHHVLASDRDVRRQLLGLWGEEILDETGAPSRPAIARLVFGEGEAKTANRQRLEAILHPAIRQELERQAAAYQAENCPALVIDAALLLEAGWDDACDVLLFVDTPAERRLQFAVTRGWDATQFRDREAAQMPVDEKRSLADVVVENHGSEEELRSQVDRFWHAHLAGRSSQ